ncbi:NAD-dependent epimerase/dehydratase family protein [Paenibacillus abyssi]|uniref:NAD dependent epimerase/dehydratase n=1 Tax=Paenibacillus abyssi TaxID=1340531 RepID=A0A917FVA9_9BACL|nr:NAD(P)-dependent oxidoreductase [Paenibacillus abyssi]GGG03962.1 NAD dependent epimerase/dehydratase [Paenibacillus abyssi]
MKVLLTGGTGFVGLNIAEALLEEGIDIVMYATSPPRPEALTELQKKKGHLHFFEGNVLDKAGLDAAFSTFGINAVIHGAAITPDELREASEGALVLQVNCVGTIEVLEAARRHAVHKFIYLSSIAAYGSATKTAELLQEETTVMEPVNLYEITKFAAERIALRYRELTGMNVIAARLGDIFGPWEHKTGVRDVMSAPFQTTRLAMLGQEALLPRSGFKHWVYSRDVAASVVSLLKAERLNHPIYNVSSPYAWSVEDWCALLAGKYPDFRYRIQTSPDLANVRLFDDNAPMEITRLTEDTGYEAQFDLYKSFADYKAWLEKHGALLSE